MAEDKYYDELVEVKMPRKYAIKLKAILSRNPDADVVEVKHGEWIEKEGAYGDIYYDCSNCKNDWTTIDGTPQDNFMRYCPYCGAKMDGERKRENE